MEDELGLVPTEKLIEELSRRYDDIVFAGSRCRNKEDVALKRYYNGAFLACAGLCETLNHIIMRDFEEALEQGKKGL